LDFNASCAKSFRTNTGLVNQSIHPKIKSNQAELGENEMFSGIFPGSGQTKPGAQGKKLAFGVKESVSG
jgi:hypothetical protein